jgi:manganese transport protein
MVFFGKDSVTVAGGAVVKFGPDSDWIRIAHLTLAPLLGTTAGQHAVCRGAARQRPEQHHHRHAGRAGRDGRLHALAPPPVDPADDLPHARHRAGDLDHQHPRHGSVTDLVNLSQVILCLILPLAMFPLLHFTSSRRRMGRWANGWFLLILGWGSVLLITAMDLYSLPASLKEAWRIIRLADEADESDVQTKFNT